LSRLTHPDEIIRLESALLFAERDEEPRKEDDFRGRVEPDGIRAPVTRDEEKEFEGTKDVISDSVGESVEKDFFNER